MDGNDIDDEEDEEDEEDPIVIVGIVDVVGISFLDVRWWSAFSSTCTSASQLLQNQASH